VYPRIHNISFDCHDTYALCGFWPAVLGADGGGWVVLADPEGNEFRVLRSAAERTRAASEETQQ
jgi:hypothetical protein